MNRRWGESVLNAELNEPLTGFDYGVEWVLAAALLFSPFAFGATNAWSQQILYGLVTVLALLVGAKLILVRGTRFVFLWTYVPIILYLLLVTISVIPLPAGLVQAISPGTFQEKHKLLADIPNVDELLRRLTISFNVWTTQRGLRMVLAVSVVFVAIVNTYRTSAQIKRLLATMTIAGVLVAALALAQDLTHVSGEPYRIFWYFDAVHPNAGPFAGHAQLGQYLNLAIGAMLALALVLVAETFQGEDPTGNEIWVRLSSLPMRIAAILALCIIAVAIAIAWSASRGALFALGVASVIVLLLVFYKRGWRKNEAGIILFCITMFAAVIFVGYDMMSPRMARLNSNAHDSADVRLTILKNMNGMFKTWPVMGTGLESFEWTYPMFEQSKQSISFYDHAENDYAQTLSDTGLVGAAITLAFLVCIFIAWGKAFAGRRPIHLAAAGIAFGLVAVLVHSTSDFSQRTPAVALESCVLVGLIVAISRLERSSTAGKTEAPAFGWSPLPGVVGTVLVVAAMGWSVWSLNGIRRAENIIVESDPTAFSLEAKPTDPDYDQKLAEYFRDPIEQDIEAVRLDPMNILYIHWLNHFRWRQLSGRYDPATTAVIYPPDAKKTGEQIATELSAARVLCPCYGKLYTLLGKIQWDLLDKPAGVKNLQTGHELRPGDSEPVFYLTQIAAERGDWAEAQTVGTHCFELDNQYVQLLVNLFVHQYHQPDVAYEVVKSQGFGLDRLVAALPEDASQQSLRDRIMQRRLELVRQAVARDPKDSNAWAGLADHLRKDPKSQPEALSAYRSALDLDYGNVPWRIAMAKLLMNMGRKDEAEQEAEICLRLSPQMDEAKALMLSIKELPRPTP